MPIIDDSGLKGSFRIVGDVAARDAINTPFRKAGMLVHVQDNNTIYQLNTDLTTWTAFTVAATPHTHSASQIVQDFKLTEHQWHLGCNGPTPTRFEIFRIGIDYNDWNSVGSTIIELHETYFQSGLKKTYAVSYGYGGICDVRLIAYDGVGTNNFQVSIGASTQVSGDLYNLSVYVDIAYYTSLAVKLTTSRTLTQNPTPGVGLAYVVPPVPVEIPTFTADATVKTAANITVDGTIQAGNLVSTTDVTGKRLLASGPVTAAALTANGTVGTNTEVILSGDSATTKFKLRLYSGTFGGYYYPVTFDAEGNCLTNANQTLAGSTTNRLKTVVGVLTSANSNGNFTSAHATPTSIFTIQDSSSGQVWIVTANVDGQTSSSYRCVFIITADNSAITATQLVKGSLANISISGWNVQYTQNSGGTQQYCNWSAIRIS